MRDDVVAGMMRRGWLISFLIFGLSAMLRADIVDDLMRIHIEALGGNEAVSEMRALRAIGQSDFGGQRMRFVMWAARPNRIRIESIDATRTQTQAWDGDTNPWRQTRGPTGRSAPERMTAAEAKQFSADANFDDVLIDAREHGGSLDYAGEGEVEGKPTQKILVTRNFFDQTVVRLDVATYLIVQQERVKDEGTARETHVVTRFFDYRAVAGVLLPHRLVVTSGGREWITTTLEKVDANPLIPPDFFSMPQ